MKTTLLALILAFAALASASAHAGVSDSDTISQGPSALFRAIEANFGVLAVMDCSLTMRRSPLAVTPFTTIRAS